MTGGPYKQGSNLEDYRVVDIPPIAILLENFRQRCYNIIFFEKPQPEGFHVSEWCMSGIGSLKEAAQKRIEDAPDFHPGLEILWNKDRSVDDLRYT